MGRSAADHHHPAGDHGGPGLRAACLLEVVAGVGSVRIPLSEDARGAVARISKGAELGAFVSVAAALAAVLHDYTGRSGFVLDIPRSVSEASPRPSAALAAAALSMDGLRTLGDLLVETQQALSRAASGSASSDVVVVPPSSAEVVVPSPGHDLWVVTGAEQLELSSPSGRLPAWLLTDLGERVDVILAAFRSVSRPWSVVEQLLTERTLARIEGFNRTDFSLPPDQTVLDRFASHAERRPDGIAVRDGEREMTYRELSRRAERLADHLRGELGIAPGSVVAALDCRGSWAIVSLLGIMRAGAVYLPLNRKLPGADLRWMAEQAEATAVVVHSSLVSTVAEHLDAIPSVIVDESTDGSVSSPAAGPGPGDPAYVIFTSGTTGVPKGVVVAHEGLLNTALDHVERLRVEPSDRYLQFMALSFDGFLLDVFTTLSGGATLVIADEPTIADPDRLARLIAEQEISLSTMTPSYLRLLAPEQLASLRVLVSAGEILEEELARGLAGRLALYNGYGPTEATVNSTLHRVSPERCSSPIPIGGPSANKRVHVVDERMRPRPPGVLGELCIAGVGLAQGYLRDPELTRAKFVDDPFGPGRLYRTGDYGAWAPDGVLLFRGRSDRQVKLRGYRIDLQEIQLALAAHPHVRSAEVLLEHAGTERAELVGFYQPERPVAVEDVRRHLAARLPEYKRPHHLVEVDPWPLTRHGKTDADQLRLAWSGASSVEPDDAGTAMASSPTEQRLGEVWSEILGMSSVPVDRGFFSLGGDSIRLIQAVHLLRRRGFVVDAADILHHPTIARLAEHLDRSELSSTSETEPLPSLTLSSEEHEGLPTEIEDAYPAALMQSYMIDQYARDDERNGAYLGCAEWRFTDPGLDESAMEEAIGRLWAEHRSLRLSFSRSPGGRDVLLVWPPGPVTIARVDLSDRPRAEQRAFFEAEIERQARDRFDPYASTPSLIRFLLARTGDDSCSLFISFHHALLDGWSGVELRNALLEHYLDAKAGRPSNRPALPVDSYREFVALERAVLDDAEARGAWQRRVQRPDWSHAMDDWDCAIRTRRSGPPAHAASQVAIPRELVQRARASSARSSVSVKALLMGATARAVMDVLGLDRLVIATITNGRSARLTQPLRSTGLFWNIVPVFLTRADATTPAMIQESLDEITPHGHFPWKEIEERLAGRPLAIPVFNFVDFHNARAGARRLSEGVVQSRFHTPLTFFIKFDDANSDENAFLRLGYDGAAFGEADVDEMRSSFHDVIASSTRSTP